MSQSSSQGFKKFFRWFDTAKVTESQASLPDPQKYVIPWPFIFLNLGVLAVFWVGWSWIAVATAVFLYVLRMFAITGFYHRYFSHRTYKTSRWFQFVLAFLGNSAAQRGPLWWAAHHRHHHRFSDGPEDPHSPVQRGFWNSHILWWSRRENIATRRHLITDFGKFPELVFLDRFDSIAPISVGVFSFAFGALLHRFAPSLHTSGWQMLVWGFCISTSVLFHGVATINSLAHVFGTRRFKTSDDSRNNFLLALITLGEGWHNNHHHYQNSVRQGFFWWEIDITFYGLKLLEKLGLVWDLKPVPERVRRPSSEPKVAEPTQAESKETQPREVERPVRQTSVTGLLPGFAAGRSPASTPARRPRRPASARPTA